MLSGTLILFVCHLVALSIPCAFCGNLFSEPPSDVYHRAIPLVVNHEIALAVVFLNPAMQGQA
jgi:hypothetical protein